MNCWAGGRSNGFRAEIGPKKGSREDCEMLGDVLEYTLALAYRRHVVGRGCKFGILRNPRTNDAILPG
jgi:hypothetical protein